MEKLDRFSAIFWLVISVGICIHSIQLGVGSFQNPGVGFLFFWSAVVMGILSIVLLLKARQGQKKEQAKSPEKAFEKVNWLKIGGVLFALVIYGLIFEWLGSLLSTTFFIAFLLRTIEVKKWYTVIFVSLVSALSTYVLFKILLQVRLPAGILSF